jgi:tRNA-dihydrouridine synthase C
LGKVKTMTFVKLGTPALVLAPMEGLTDAPMRTLQAETGAFTYAVSEFLRISGEVPPRKVFYHHVPELLHGSRTPNGLPVQVQILGGDASRMAQSARVVYEAGANAIDINFGCPAKTVNRHDGGASLLRHPARIEEIVAAVRNALPPEVPVSAKIRLGWDCTNDVFENAARAEAGGADWLTIHARTRAQGYHPPVNWALIGAVRERLNIPVVANGDIWTLQDFQRCRAETGCEHFMLGRGALADPALPRRVAHALGLVPDAPPEDAPCDWPTHLCHLVTLMELGDAKHAQLVLCRLKQWLKIASFYGDFPAFDQIKRADSVSELLAGVQKSTIQNML